MGGGVVGGVGGVGGGEGGGGNGAAKTTVATTGTSVLVTVRPRATVKSAVEVAISRSDAAWAVSALGIKMRTSSANALL